MVYATIIIAQNILLIKKRKKINTRTMLLMIVIKIPRKVIINFIQFQRMIK